MPPRIRMVAGMTDRFALLDLPRSAALDDAALRDAFHRRAAERHPDVVTGDAAAFAMLNDAFATLRDPARRLRHLLELENPEALAKPAVIPAEIAELFPVVGEARAAMVDAAEKRAAATTALSRAMLGPSETAARKLAAGALVKLWTVREAAVAELPAADGDAGRLSSLHQRFSYLGKWEAQLREAVLQLDIA